MRRFVAGLLVVLAGAGCEQDEPDVEALDPPDLAFDYATEDLTIEADTLRCAGDLQRWQAFADFVESYLGRKLPAPVELYVWDQQDDFGGIPHCGLVSGCLDYESGRVFAVDESVEHELVHAVAAVFPNRDAFFSEGLAVALSGSTEFGPYAPVFPVARPEDVDYVSAGHFVRWLIETHGIEAVIDHLESSGSLAQFEQRFGPLDEVVEAFVSTAPAVYPPLYVHPTPTLDERGVEIWASELDVDCDAHDVVGAKDGIEIIRLLTVPKSGFFSLWSSTGGPIRATSIATADANPSPLLGFEVPASAIGALPIEAGTYELAVLAPPGVEAGELWVWAQHAANPVVPGAEP